MSNILKVFEYSNPYKRKVFGDGGKIDSDRLLKSLLLFFVQNNLDSNVLFAWNEFAGAKDGKCYNHFGSNDLTGTQEYDRGMALFNGTDQNATLDVSGYSTIAIAYRTVDEVIITNSLTGLGEISGNTLYLGSNAAETEFYSFDLLALVVLNTSAYQLVESYLEMVPLGSKLNLIDEYKTVLAAMPTQPLVSDQKIQNTWLKQMVDGGYYAKAEFLDMFSVHAEDSSLLNWKNPGIFNPQKVATPAFTTYQGFKANSANNSMINLNFNPNDDKILSGKENVTYIIGIGDDIAENFYDFGGADANGNATLLLSRHFIDRIYVNLNGLPGNVFASNNSAKSHIALSRNSATEFNTFRNNVKTTFTKDSGNHIVDLPLGVGGRNNNGTWQAGNKTIRYIFGFSYLTDIEIQDVIQITENYLQKYNSGLSFLITEYDLTTEYNNNTLYG